MKLGEVADLLTGLASALERFVAKAALNDLNILSACLRQFPDESAKGFCDFVVKAKQGRTAPARGTAALDEGMVAHFVAEIQRFLANRDRYDVASLRQLAAQIGKVKVPEIKAIGERVGCPLGGTKAKMVGALGDWLANIKLSAEQSSFRP